MCQNYKIPSNNYEVLYCHYKKKMLHLWDTWSKLWHKMSESRETKLKFSVGWNLGRKSTNSENKKWWNYMKLSLTSETLGWIMRLLIENSRQRAMKLRDTKYMPWNETSKLGVDFWFLLLIQLFKGCAYVECSLVLTVHFYLIIPNIIL